MFDLTVYRLFTYANRIFGFLLSFANDFSKARTDVFVTFFNLSSDFLVFAHQGAYSPLCIPVQYPQLLFPSRYQLIHPRCFSTQHSARPHRDVHLTSFSILALQQLIALVNVFAFKQRLPVSIVEPWGKRFIITSRKRVTCTTKRRFCTTLGNLIVPSKNKMTFSGAPQWILKFNLTYSFRRLAYH